MVTHAAASILRLRQSGKAAFVVRDAEHGRSLTPFLSEAWDLQGFFPEVSGMGAKNTSPKQGVLERYD